MRKYVSQLAAAERAEFAEFLTTLTAAQWNSSTLCDQWSVKDVVAHTLAYLRQTRIALTRNTITARFNLDTLNEIGLQHYSHYQPSELIELMKRDLTPTGAGGLFGGRVALIECLIHQQDIRRPLNLPREIPAARLIVALNFARSSPVIRGAWNTRGVRLTATDINWSAGHGLPVTGTAEALLLTLRGRSHHLVDELAGPGVELLLKRSASIDDAPC